MSREDAALTAAHNEVKSELARTDTKASLLLAFNGALLAGVLTAATNMRMNTAGVVVGAAGTGVLLASVALLLLTVRPNLNGGGGFPHWATLAPDQLRAHLVA
ncbi:Pycsar system effector family protein, partial [Streptomyces iconiensis]